MLNELVSQQILVFNGCQMLPFFGLPWLNLKIGQNNFYDFYRFWKLLKNAINCLNCETSKTICLLLILRAFCSIFQGLSESVKIIKILVANYEIEPQEPKRCELLAHIKNSHPHNFLLILLGKPVSKHPYFGPKTFGTNPFGGLWDIAYFM